MKERLKHYSTAIDCLLVGRNLLEDDDELGDSLDLQEELKRIEGAVNFLAKEYAKLKRKEKQNEN